MMYLTILAILVLLYIIYRLFYNVYDKTQHIYYRMMSVLIFAPSTEVLEKYFNEIREMRKKFLKVYWRVLTKKSLGDMISNDFLSYIRKYNNELYNDLNIPL